MIGLGRWKACLLGVRYAVSWRASMRLCPQEMEPPNTLQCELRSYQKQALHWMAQLEIGYYSICGY
jgi:hypothetical protein